MVEANAAQAEGGGLDAQHLNFLQSVNDMKSMHWLNQLKN